MPTRSLAARLTERVVLAFGGQEWPILFSHDALLEIEEVSRKSVLAGEVNLLRPSASVLRWVVAVMLRREGCSDVAGAIAYLLHPFRRHATQALLVQAWRAAMPEAEPWRSSKTEAKDDETRTWVEVWADNRIHLNVSDETWLEMTPRMVQLLSRERMEIVRQREWAISNLTAVTINHGWRPAKETVPNDKFMMHPWPKKQKDGEMSNAEIIAKMRPYAALFREGQEHAS